MKKIILSIIVLFTSINSSFAINYGDEWNEYNNSSSFDVEYSDVPANHWAYTEISRTTAKNWFGGYPDGTFRPNSSITRAEALKVFVSFLSLELQNTTISSYYDVDVNDWYSPYIEAGKELFPEKITIQGKSPFQPDMPITREDTIYAIVKALGYDKNIDFTDQSILNMFNDKNSISNIVKPYIATAINRELASGYPDRTIRAQDPLTRAEFAALLYRASFYGPDFTSNNIKLQSINISSSSKQNLKIGESFAISATATYSDNTTKSYTNLNPYVTDNNEIVLINKNTITALKPGTCEIKFNNDNLKDKFIIVIVEKPDDAPTLKIDSYPKETTDNNIKITGKIDDTTDTQITLNCNGKNIDINSNGTFSVIFNLEIGTNEFNFIAENEYNNKTSKTIMIIRNEIEEEAEKHENNNEFPETTVKENDNISNEKENEVYDTPKSNYLMELCPPYETSNMYTKYLQSEGKSFKMGGKSYTNGFTLKYRNKWVLINLDKKYSSVDLVIGHVDDTNMHNQTIIFLVDNSIIKEIEIKPDSLPETISIPLNYGSLLKIMTTAEKNYSVGTGFGNIILHN